MAKNSADTAKNDVEVTEVAVQAPQPQYNPNERNWMKPSKRAEFFVEEQKSKKHEGGKKKGQELTPTEKAFRSGYLLCQSDHAGMHIYKTVIQETNDKDKATIASRIKGYFKRKKAEKEAKQ